MKNQKSMSIRLNVILAMLSLFVFQIAWSQTYYDMSSADYSQSFTAWSGYPVEWNGNAINATGVIPAATKLTAATTTLGVIGTGTAAGYDLASSTKLVMLTTGATDNSASIGVDLNLNMSMRNAGTLSFDAATIFNNTGNRISSLRVYYTTDNNNWSEITGTNLPYLAQNNVAGSASISVSLPSAISNQSQVKLRFYCHNSGGTGSTTGSRPKISIDNVAVTSTMQLPPSVYFTQSLTNFTATEGAPSAAQTFTVNGSDLWSFVTITAPTGFEISLSSNSGYASFLNLNPTGSTLPTTTIYIRLSGSNPIGQYMGPVEFASTGAASQQFVTPDGSVFAASGVDQTITFGAFPSATYGDSPLTLSGSASSGLPITYISSNTAVATITGSTLTIVGVGSASITAAQSGDATYNPATDVVQVLVVSPKSLTIDNAAASNKQYNNSNAAVITGTLNGVVGSDDVSLNGTGTFASVDVADGIVVTSTSTLTGTAAGNYTLVQPTGLTANITPATATITFSALPNYSTANASFNLGATVNSGATISYTSSNTAVATVSGNVVTIVGAGTSTITASAPATSNYNAATDATQTLTVTSALIAFDFTGLNTTATATPTYVLPGLVPAASQLMTRGSGAVASAGANSFRTQGFQNNGIATTNTDYFQFTVSANPGLGLNFTSIDARFNGTASFYAAPGVTSQFAYSLDGTNFTLIGTAAASTVLIMPQVDLTGVTALQNIQPGTTVTFRYYASGQTTTGGWGFSSPSLGAHGLVIGGSTFAVPCPFYADLDGDGYGNPSSSQNATCGSTVAGYVELINTDCDDAVAGINPGATENTCNGVDDDCDLTIDEGFVAGCNDPSACNYVAGSTCSATCDYTQQTYYLDTDGDGYGVSTSTQLSCAAPVGYVLNSGDCDETNIAINPGATEVNCNLIDDNCSGVADEGSVLGCMDVNATNYNASASCPSTCNYSDFTAGNVVALRLGTGSAALSAAGTAVFLEEMSSSSVVNTIAIPTTGNARMVLHGSSTAEAQMTRSSDGSVLILPGYDAAAGTASINSTTSDLVPRVISTIGLNAGTFQRATSTNTFFSANNFRSATSNGTDYWGVGSNGGVNYFGNGTPSGVSVTSTNNRVISVQNGQLYLSTGSGTRGIYKVGVGMPAVSGTTAVIEIPTGASSSPYAFQFSTDGNTCFIADDNTSGIGGVQKWTKSGSTWSLAYTIALGTGAGARGLAVDYYAGVNPRVYAVKNDAAGTYVVYFDDNGTSSPTVNVVASALTASNKAYRSVAFAPCTASTWYADVDGDGYGAAGSSLSYCTQPYGYVSNSTDCDDAVAAINPAASEICDGLDNDCVSGADNGLNFVDYYNDVDGDTYGAGTATNACQSPGASYVTNNTDCDDASSSAYPGGTEVCGNGVDEDCSGSDLNCPNSGFTAAVNVLNIGQYGTGSQATQNVNLATGINTVQSPGLGLDKWFSFTATSNAMRIALTGNATMGDDNDLSLYETPTDATVQLIPIASENDVHPGNQGAAADGGNETLIYDQLIVGDVYYLCVRNNNNTPGNVSLTVSNLNPSTTDIALYTNGTNTFTNTCQNFKVKYRANSAGYTINRWASNDISGTPTWSYAIPVTSTVASTICQLGKVAPANLSGSNQTVYVTVDVLYNLTDAFGTVTPATARGNAAASFQLASEADLNVRTNDRCAAGFKSTASSIATNRSVCGTTRYVWEMTMVYPQASLPLEVQGPLGGSRVLMLNAVPAIANGQRYDVRVASKHVDGLTVTAYGSTQCVKTLGAAGMPTIEDEITVYERSENGITATIYPNPNNGQTVNFSITGFEGALNVRVSDATGRQVYSNLFMVEGAMNTTLEFAQTLANGIYMVELLQNGELKTMRMVVSK